ncbi:DinB family protein [Streptomyces sulphureus]|uniref:DinB family protein n=1 Tax=Streptomyces sulphureus TaxID=47758 RepID=UPI000373767C|nr:DinB family protein [Streptomyces sulphureus]
MTLPDAAGGTDRSPPPSPEEPSVDVVEPAALLAGHLDRLRSGVETKLAGLSEEQLHSSLLPSGWSPLQLVWHLVHVERRWLRWGFRAEQLTEPWGDEDADERWRVPPGMSTAEVLEAFRTECARSRAVCEGADLRRRAEVGGRFGTTEEAPTLSWILFHLLQEYARHLGQLDVVRELSDGAVGE